MVEREAALRVDAVKHAHVGADGGVNQRHALEVVGADVERQHIRKTSINLMPVRRVVDNGVDAAEQLSHRELAQVLVVAHPQRPPKHGEMAAVGDLCQDFGQLAFACCWVGDGTSISSVEKKVDKWRELLQLAVKRL
jgi:hypothetical protein